MSALRSSRTKRIFKKEWIYIIISAWVAVAGTEELEVQAHFDRKGEVLAPISYEHLGLTLNWTEIEVDLHAALDLVDRQFAKWAAGVEASDDSTEYKRMRVKFVRHLIEHEKEDAKKAVQRMAEALMDEDDRTKRGALGTLAGIVGLGSGLYASFEVSQIEKQVQANHRELVASRAIEKKLTAALKTWANQLSNEKADVEFTRVVKEEFQDFARRTDQIVEVVLAASQNRLHHSMLQDTMVKQSVQKMVNSISKRGFRTVETGMDVVSMAHVSHVRFRTGIRIILHVPIVQKNIKSLPLFRMVPVEVNQNGVALRFSSERDLIAVDVETKEHLVFSESDLQRCQKRAETWSCEAGRLRYKVPKTCVAALYFRNAAAAVVWCDHLWQPVKSGLVEVQPGLYSLSEKTPVIINCPDQAAQQRELDVLQVPANCTAAADDFRVLEAPDFVANSSRLAFNLTFKSEDFGLGGAQYFEQVRLALEDYKVAPVAPLPKALESLWTIVIIIIVVGLAFAVGVAIYVMWRFWKTYRAKAARTVRQEAEDFGLSGFGDQRRFAVPPPSSDRGEVVRSSSNSDESRRDATEEEEEERASSRREARQSRSGRRRQVVEAAVS